MRAMNRSLMLFVTVSLLVAGFVAWGTLRTSTAAAPAGPSVGAQGKYPISVKAGEYDLLTVVLDFAPGAGIPKHTHGGEVLVTVLSGEITLREMSMTKKYKAGQGWTEKPGAVHAAANEGKTNARVLVTALLPKGAELTTLVKP
jgi:quercetin dioxygenase-like cupin family protein